MDQIQTIPKPVSDFVFIEGNRIVTDSLTVAQMFGKRHDHVMRDIEIQIEKLIEAGEQKWGITNFGETQYQHPQNKQWYDKYNLTEDAFAIVAMSYVTPEAMKMKVKFIKEFKRMKEHLQKKTPSSREQFLATMQLGLQHEEDLKQLKTDVEQIKNDINERMTVDYSQQTAIRNAVNRRVYKLWNDGIVNRNIHDTRRKVFSALWKDIYASFAVNSYHNIRQRDFDEVIDYIKVWRPRLV
ncbi:Rha family transcriptional regulator [Bacillus cytotoxicus]|nr:MULTISPECIES: Rha family transcriptional regulator [Bacillus cereus group]QTR81198.1 Rha family transcriptional regulator [Bacillus cytotoxicus]